jgi:integrase
MVSKQGRYADGLNNLYLQVRGNSKSWIFRYRNSRFGKPGWTEMGIGSVHTYTLDEAREEARLLYQQLLKHIDPMVARKADKAAKQLERAKHTTFAECAAEYLEVMPKKNKWSKHHLTGGKRSVNKYLTPVLGPMLIGTITHLHVYEVFKEISYAKPAQAHQVHIHAQAIFKRVKARGLITGDNPASLEGPLGDLLPNFRDREVEHEPGIAYEKAGWLVAQLRTPFVVETTAWTLKECAEATGIDRSHLLREIHDGKLKAYKKPGTESLNTISSPWLVEPTDLQKVHPLKSTPDRQPLIPLESYVIEFQLLNAARPSEARMMRWSEFDENKKLWTIPPHRHKPGRKTKKPLLKPLCTRAMAILQAMRAKQKEEGIVSEDFVFAQWGSRLSKSFGKPMSDATERTHLARFVPPSECTLHGLRSTFKGWAHEVWRRDNVELLTEVALGHKIGNATRNAYAEQVTLLEPRRPMMEAWGEYCDRTEPLPAVVVPILQVKGDSHA